MFIDEVILTCKAWKWGDGIVSWRKEKYIPKWGPFGGDGGKWGDIILRATTHETTLVKFRHVKLVKADDGEKWGNQEMHWANAENLIIEVPVGTLVTDTEDGTTICDLTKPGEEYILCEWGRGGYGNAHFPSSTRQAPAFAELGDSGDIREVKLELKLVADVGLVGLPNAGKSTVIQSITNVKPKIADYAFTTLIPNLGVMEWKGRSLVIEDVPGLIEGASEGKGLGFQFLKHIDRCRIIIHLIDASVGEEEMVANYRTIRKELENWNKEMAEKEELIVLSKADIIDPEMLREMQKYFEKETGKKVALTISAWAYIRTDELKDLLLERIPEIKKEQKEIREDSEWYLEATEDDKNIKIYDLKRARDPKKCSVKKREDGDYEVTGERIEEIARMTDLRYVDGVNRIYDVMEKLGVIRKVKAMVMSEMTEGHTGFFEGEEDIPSPSIWISGKKFSLENIIFMRGERE